MSYTKFITDIQTIETDNIIFGKPRDGEQGFKRISISIKEENPEGTHPKVRRGPLYIMTEERHCFGIQKNTPYNNGIRKDDDSPPTGYTLPIAMWDMDAPTEEQLVFLEGFEKISERCIDHLVQPDTKKLLKKVSLTRERVSDKFTPLWRKTLEDGSGYDTTKGPVMYAKLYTERNPDTDTLEITTKFQDSNGEPVDPLTLVGNSFRANRCLLHVHSIYVGNMIKLQVRVAEVEIQARQRQVETLMLCPRKAPAPTPKPEPEIEEAETEEQEQEQAEEEQEEQVEEEKQDDDDDEEYIPPPKRTPSRSPKEEVPEVKQEQPAAPPTSRRRKVL